MPSIDQVAEAARVFVFVVGAILVLACVAALVFFGWD